VGGCCLEPASELRAVFAEGRSPLGIEEEPGHLQHACYVCQAPQDGHRRPSRATDGDERPLAERSERLYLLGDDLQAHGSL